LRLCSFDDRIINEYRGIGKGNSSFDDRIINEYRGIGKGNRST
jgi:hypothetical protein